MNCLVIECERIILRQMTVEDAPFMVELNSDPEVIRYTGDPPFESIRQAEDFVRAYDTYTINGFGRWLIEEKANGRVIGFCGLKKRESGEIDLGYRLMRAWWGKGYATEACRACIVLGRDFYGMKTLIAECRVENTASVRVIEKLGFTLSSKSEDCGGETFVFRLEL